MYMYVSILGGVWFVICGLLDCLGFQLLTHRYGLDLVT